MRTALLLTTLLRTTACRGGKSANCVVEVNGVTACTNGNSSMAVCRNQWNGEPFPGWSSGHPNCVDLGYTVPCGHGPFPAAVDMPDSSLLYFAKDFVTCATVNTSYQPPESSASNG
jgi:hypothetical protein